MVIYEKRFYQIHLENVKEFIPPRININSSMKGKKYFNLLWNGNLLVKVCRIWKSRIIKRKMEPWQYKRLEKLFKILNWNEEFQSLYPRNLSRSKVLHIMENGCFPSHLPASFHRLCSFFTPFRYQWNNKSCA